MKTRRHTSHRDRPRCGLNRCGSSGGSSYVKDRPCISSRCSTSASSRHEHSSGQQACRGYSLNYSCAGRNISYCRGARRGHKNPASPRLRHCSSSTLSKASVASTRSTASSSSYCSRSISGPHYSLTSRRTSSNWASCWRTSTSRTSRSSRWQRGHEAQASCAGHRSSASFGGRCKDCNTSSGGCRSAKRSRWRSSSTSHCLRSSSTHLHSRRRRPSSSLTLRRRVLGHGAFPTRP